MDTADAITRLNAALEGRYRIERELGEGGMAIVYFARDLRHVRPVALKVLKPEVDALRGAKRFLAEIRTTANLQHPHILPLFDSGQVDSFLYYVMPYVEGETLRDLLEREGRLEIDEATRITTAMASALHYAHEHGIVHRDVKPSNVMLSGGLPVVMDFGVALALEQATGERLTLPGSPLGTPPYVSPEQATGDGSVDARSDVYSLGCVLYELLSGEPPHRARSAQAIVAKRLTVPASSIRSLRPEVPARIDRALARALQLQPRHRQQTIVEFSRELAPDVGRSGSAEAPLRRGAPIAPAQTPFIGRAKERAALLKRLDDVGRGRGSLILLGGEAGVGKTRLSEFLLEEARKRGYMSVVGHAYEVEGTPPFAPFLEQLEYTARVVPPGTFREALGDAAPEIARIMPTLRQHFLDIEPAIELPPDQIRHYLFHQYRDFLERAARIAPLVSLFDDLHWADEGSLLLLEHLARNIHDMPVLTVATYRDSELDATRPLAASFERLLNQHSLYRISLKPLPKAEVAELLEALGGSSPPGAFVDAIVRGTEGNPFFIHEVFLHLQEEGRLFDNDGAWRTGLASEGLEVPESVRLVVGRRLERLSADCQAMLTTASVIGPRFSLPVLEAAGDLSGEDLLDAIDAAEGAQLIDAVSTREPVYKFTHQLIRQTLVERLSVPRRQRFHLRIADAMKQVLGDRVEDRASDLAHHLFHSGAAADSGETLRFLRVAGDQALARSGYEEALAHFERALSLHSVPEGLAPVLMEGKVNALDGIGRWQEVIEAGRQALEMYEAVGDTDGLARVARLVCYRLEWRMRYRDAAELGRSALAKLSEAPSPYRARLKCQLGTALDLIDEPGSRELIEEGLSEAEDLGAGATVLHGKALLAAWWYHQGFFVDAIRVCGEGRELLKDAADQTTRADFLWIEALTLPLVGRLEEAERAIGEAREVGKERSEVGAELCAAFGEVTVAGMRTGDGRRIETLSKALAEGFREAGGWARAGHVWAGLGCLWRGEMEAAVELMAVEAGAIREPRLWGSLAGGWRFRTAAYAGRADAKDFFERVEPTLFKTGRRAFPGDGFGLHAAIEGLAVLGEIDAAARLYDDAAESLGRGTVGHIDGLWECTTGIAAACGANWEAAEGHFAAALAQAEDLPHMMARNDIRRWLAWTLLRRRGRGDTQRARQLLEEASTGYEQLGARLYHKIAREVLATKA